MTPKKVFTLLKYVKGLVSENSSAVDVLKRPKNYWNLQKITSVLLFHHSKPSWVRKSHFWSDLRFWDCLLTRWLPTTSIYVVIGEFTATNSDTIIWKTKNVLLHCYCIFGIYIKFEPHSFSISEFIDSKKGVYLNV